eukprot:2104083-Prymnesium_polylepis.1
MLPSRRRAFDGCHQMHRSDRRYGTHPTPRTLPAIGGTRRPCRRCDRYRASARVVPSDVRP